MGKVLFLGCNYDQVPYLKAAQDLGFFVVGTDLNKKAPGAVLADSFHHVGYTDVDELVRIMEIENFENDDKIFTASAHFAYEGATAVAEASGLSFLKGDVADICLNKTRCYPFLKKNGVPVPKTKIYDASKSIRLDANKVYYVKSDYGKSPKYCYRIADGKLPELPTQHDPFYRKNFLIQEEVKGDHYRINYYGNEVAVFRKFTDMACVPNRVIGPGHHNVVKKLKKVVNEMGLNNMLSKFDVIVNEVGWFVIDIGLDPPLRLKTLCDFLGVDFAAAYTRFYLLKDPEAMPKWEDICLPVLIQGSPNNGVTCVRIS